MPKIQSTEMHEGETVSNSCEDSTTLKTCLSVQRNECKTKWSRCCESCSHDSHAACIEDSLDSQTSAVISLQGKCYISCLPNEILLHIFSFLRVRELCVSVAPVCTTWRDLAKDPTLWTHLVFSEEDRADGDRVKSLLRASPSLVSLELSRREDGGNLLLQVAASCNKLRELTVQFCDGLTEAVFKDLVIRCPNIRYLNMEGCQVHSTQCFHIIGGFRQLQYLHLSRCQLLDNAGLTIIARQCNHLEYLNIDGIIHIHDSSVMFLTKKLSHCLKNLFLDGEYLTDASFRSLRDCSLLQKLEISFCEQMTDDGLSGIYGLEHLTWLKLRRGIQLTPGGLKAMFHRLPQLVYVDLSECCLMDDSVLWTLASMCPRLEHLRLNWCSDLTDGGIAIIVVSCPRLQVVELVGIQRLTGTALISIPRALPNLVILHLKECKNVDNTILRYIVAEKPSLCVFDCSGNLVEHHEPSNNDSVSK
ncbi:F-box/LRR-repeat protein 20 isoform X2 [Cherax quadricarinatus]|uniref:F-box/LRR-repeat protein 20 isoform X2 n=1 Tax=Cherax quadricarinatus TaxID=27406 RepID=UPI002378EC45|nr:F-box/LRR-repeat protein 2-like [Cherax quadricarinatus]